MAELESFPNRLKSTALAERPQERLERLGAGALSDAELLAMLLRSGTRGHDVLTLATDLINRAGSLAGLITWTAKDFARLKGIGHVKALQLLTVTEIARRVLQHEQSLSPILGDPAQIADYMRPFVLGLQVERFWTLCLNRKNRLLRRVDVSSGTTSSTLIHPREVFREAIREGASAIVCVHNHPSGDPAPSAADIRATRTLREAARTVEIDLLDHIIVGNAGADPTGMGYYSFRSSGIL